ncbi:MAG: hypothetical protein ACRC63_00155, partial [Metamycoplasmataceae bacterium]
LVYNNPFGIGISSTLFAIIKLGSVHLKAPFDPLTGDFAQIMFGIIIYIAAIAIVFEKLNVYTYIKNNYIYYVKSHYVYYNDYNYKEILDIYKAKNKEIALIKKTNNLAIKEIKTEKKSIWKEIIKESIAKKEAMDAELLNKNKNKIADLNEETQQYYFDQISEIKKDKDNALYQNRYFEISGIKNITKSARIENKNMLRIKKKEVIEAFNLERKHLKLIKQTDISRLAYKEIIDLYKIRKNEISLISRDMCIENDRILHYTRDQLAQTISLYKNNQSEINDIFKSSTIKNKDMIQQKIFEISEEFDIKRNNLKFIKENAEANSKYEKFLNLYKNEENEITTIMSSSNIENDNILQTRINDIKEEFISIGNKFISMKESK